MSWFFYAVIARLGWAACNMADHYVARHITERPAFTNVVMTNWFVAPILCGMAVIWGLPAVPDLPVLGWIALAALFGIAGSFPYFMALRRDEAYNIMPLFEFTPVFVLVLAFLFLGEALSPLQLLCAAGCIIAGFLFMWDFERGHIKLNTLFIMMASAFMFAVYQVIVRHIGDAMTPYDYFFWVFSLIIVFATLIGLVNGATAHAIDAIRQSRWHIVRPLIFAESTNTVANFSLIMAIAFAPTAGHASALSGLQPIFVFALSQMLSYIMPGHYPRLGWTRDVQIKLVLLAVMIACALGLKLL